MTVKVNNNQFEGNNHHDKTNLCLDLGSTTDASKKNNSQSGAGVSGTGVSYRLRQFATTPVPVVRVERYSGSATSNTEMNAHLISQNLPGSADAVQNGGWATPVPDGTCQNPTGLP